MKIIPCRRTLDGDGLIPAWELLHEAGADKKNLKKKKKKKKEMYPLIQSLLLLGQFSSVAAKGSAIREDFSIWRAHDTPDGRPGPGILGQTAQGTLLRG